MTRLYLIGGVIALLIAGGVYLRMDAVWDERERVRLERLEQNDIVRGKINDAIEDSRASGADWRERLRNAVNN